MRTVNVLDRRRLLDDVFKVDEVHVDYERFDGSMAADVRRLVFERGDSVAAVVLNRSSGRLLFTEQLRVPTLNSGPGWLVEVMAGMIDAGETPEAALLRELEEELGFRVEHLEAIANFFVSPGGSSERIWLYYAEVEDSGRVGLAAGWPASKRTSGPCS